MKWYTRAWQRGDLPDAESDRRDKEYATYVNSIADRLAPHVLDFALPRHEHMWVHDGYLDVAEFDPSSGRVVIVLVNGSLQTGYGHFEIVMSGVTAIEPKPDDLRGVLADPRTEFLTQEVHLLDDGRLEVAFLLWPAGEFAVRCGDVRTDWQPTASRDDHRNIVRVMRRGRRRDWPSRERDSVFAGLVARFAAAVDRLRGRRPGFEVEFTEQRLHLDDDDDGGLASSRVPRRPPDRPGSGSAAVTEPTDPRDIGRH